MKSVILDSNGVPFSSNGHAKRQELSVMARGRRRVHATYDGARDSQEYQRHWANTDALSADASNSPGVRKTLVGRSRYEAGSNGYYDGILNTHVNMMMGTGPQLRMMTEDKDHNRMVEQAWKRWVKLTGFRSTLWTMAHARVQDGETFGILQQNPAIDFDVQLQVMAIETEQVQSRFGISTVRNADGIHFDDLDNIIFYEVLPYHPGGTDFTTTGEPVPVDPSSVVHWLKKKRPGTHRSIPALTSTLNVGANARRWREATLAGAETAADFSVLLKTPGPANDEEDLLLPTPMSTLPLEKRMMVALPESVEPHQLRPEQPTSNHDEFNRSLISEQARPISQPYNAAAGDSSTYSFASGKLDTLSYRAELDIDRVECSEDVLDPVFEVFYAELALVRGLDLALTEHEWAWPAHPVIDTVAEANATNTKLQNGTTTLRKVYADAGEDFEEQLLVMTKDYFGDISEESVQEMRQILLRTNFPAAVPNQPQTVGVDDG